MSMWRWEVEVDVEVEVDIMVDGCDLNLDLGGHGDH